MKKYLPVLILSVLFSAGCVSINDPSVQVQRPGEVEAYQRNVLDKCPSHAYPHRLVMAETGLDSPLGRLGSQMTTNQQDFDKWWAYLVNVDYHNVTTSSLNQEPVVNWNQEQAYFLVVPIDNACQKAKPFGDEMTTDCYSLTAHLYWYLEGNPCPPPIYYHVFIFIYAQTGWPVNIEWVQPTPTPTMTPKPIPTATPTPKPESDDE